MSQAQSPKSQPQTQPKAQPPVKKERIRTPAEIAAQSQANLLTEDDYTTELRIQVVHLGENLLNRTKYEVDILERELVALSGVFNEFLSEVKVMDKKIGDLSTSINQGKMQAARELDSTIKQEIQTIVEQLRVLPRADLDGVEMLYQNLDALQDNYGVLQKQLDTLEEIGVKINPIRKNLPALERGLNQFGDAIEKQQMKLLVGEEEEEKIDYDALKNEIVDVIRSQHRAMIKHLHQAQTLSNPKEVSMLKKNQKGFEKSLNKVKGQLTDIAAAGVNVEGIQAQLKPLESGLLQFEKALSSNQFLKMTERIFEEIKLTQEQIEEAQNCNNLDDLEILQENIEILYENCDAVADELETMESHGLAIDGVLEHYDVLRVTIEQFERITQDASNRLHLTQS